MKVNFDKAVNKFAHLVRIGGANHAIQHLNSCEGSYAALIVITAKRRYPDLMIDLILTNHFLDLTN